MNKYPASAVEQSGNIAVVVCKENGRFYRLNNASNAFIQKIRVDGQLITTGIRCDYAVDAAFLKASPGDEEPKTRTEDIFLIELKGTDKKHACEQILATYRYFLEHYYADRYHCRIVLSKDTAPKILPTDQKKLLQLEKQGKIDFKMKSNIIEDTL